jgi:hypothetical protein
LFASAARAPFGHSRGLFPVGIATGDGVFHAAALPSLSTPRATILIASSGNGRCSALEPSVTVIEERERHQIVERFASRLEPLDAGGWCLS